MHGFGLERGGRSAFITVNRKQLPSRLNSAQLLRSRVVARGSGKVFGLPRWLPFFSIPPLLSPPLSVLLLVLTTPRPILHRFPAEVRLVRRDFEGSEAETGPRLAAASNIERPRCKFRGKYLTCNGIREGNEFIGINNLVQSCSTFSLFFFFFNLPFSKLLLSGPVTASIKGIPRGKIDRVSVADISVDNGRRGEGDIHVRLSFYYIVRK